MPTLTIPKTGVRDIVEDATARFHPDLDNLGVTVGLLMHWPSEDAKEPQPLKLNGYPCAALVKITGNRERVLGLPDAVITFDGLTWKDLSEPERLALVDHELTHLEIDRDSEGAIKRDDAGRPKLKMRLHDYSFGWFRSIAERHGIASFEVKQAREIKQACGQLLFDFDADEPASPDLDDDARETVERRAMAGASR